MRALRANQRRSRRWGLSLATCAVLFLPMVTSCATTPPNDPGAPVQNIDPARHGNLAAAQALSSQAYDRIAAAQIDNNDDLGGHAARAKAILRQVNQELRLAADAANQR